MTRELRIAALVAWALASVILTLAAWQSIAHLWFPDSDDAMRLLEVRDWLAGQGWWDVAQHRLVGPTGADVFAMHWSRIVDLPIASVMLLAAPLGEGAATRIALTGVPLAILLAVTLLMARIVSTLAGEDRARLAMLLVPLSPPLVYQIHPMRIDHHGWQTMLALAAIAALLSTPTRRSGAVTGGALAMLLAVSLEGLPITAAILGVGLLAWAYDPTRRAQAVAMTATLVGGVAVLHAIQRGPAMLAPACDAISPAWIGALAAAGAGIGATLFLARSLRTRVRGILASAVAAAITLRLAAPVCTQGPFATLDPLVYRLWYLNVAEGMPLWGQKPAIAFMLYPLPVVGLAGTVVAWRASADKVRWSMMLAIAGAAFAFSILVARGGATANALAIPGAAWLLHAWLTRARAIPLLVPRLAATTAALVCAAPGLAATLLVDADTRAQQAHARAVGAAAGLPPCDEGHEIADLARLPAGLVYTPLDVSPLILVATPHRAIAGGYHRNADAIHAVVATFTGSPEEARAAILASGADYVAGCPGENETALYKHEAPGGFWARLERGERVPWLERVSMPGSPVLAWRVVREPLLGRAPGP